MAEVEERPPLPFELVAEHAAGDRHQPLPLFADVHVGRARFRVEVDRRVPWIGRTDGDQVIDELLGERPFRFDALVDVLVLVELVPASERLRVERDFIPTAVQVTVRPHHRVIADEAVAAKRNDGRRAQFAILLVLRDPLIPRRLVSFVCAEGWSRDDRELVTVPRLRAAVAGRRRKDPSSWCDLMTRSAFARLSIASSVELARPMETKSAPLATRVRTRSNSRTWSA